MLKTLAIATLLAGIGIPALADDQHHPSGQQPATEQSSPGMKGGHGMMGAGKMACCPMMMSLMSGKHIEGHLAFLKAELKITSGQERAWGDFAAGVRGAAKGMQGMGAMGSGGMSGHDHKMSAPDAMNMHIGTMESHLKTMKALQAATAKLYPSLSTEQKAMADELLGGKGMM